MLSFTNVCKNLMANSMSILLLENVIINTKMTMLTAMKVNCISIFSPHLHMSYNGLNESESKYFVVPSHINCTTFIDKNVDLGIKMSF